MGITAKAGTKGLQGYPALDVFRFVAALLVVANHTSPLWSVSETGDFVLTRVVARLAVPFFFMASGFFFAKNSGKTLGGFLAKMAKLYGLCILLYLPLNWYMGYFAQPGLALRLVKDILWNGTAYHLWYFPGIMLGSCIAYACRKYLRPAVGVGLCIVLYIIGLGGDSWYALAGQVPALKSAYGALFMVFDYTRNGLLFAPLFVLLGMLFAGGSLPQPRKPGLWAAGLAAAFAAMLAEALWLRQVGGALHDSMYLALPVCAVLLFGLLLQKRGQGHVMLRKLSGTMYIIHLWCIILVRGAAKVLGLQSILVDISPVFFLCACALTVGAAFVWVKLPKPWQKPPQGGSPLRAWKETDENALRHNLQQARALLPPGGQVMAVVKDDAYGHGAVWAARALQKQGVRAFAVATLEEGAQLRRHGVRGEILVLGYTHPAKAFPLWLYRLTQTAVDLPHAKALAATGLRLRVHIKADTGMHRLGVSAEDLAAFEAIYRLPLRVEGVYTHLARADSRLPEDEAFTQKQINAYYALLEQLAGRGIQVGKTHLQSSHGLAYHPGLPCHYARCGLMLYGAMEAPGLRLKPVLALKATVASVRQVAAGQWVGYGQGHQCAHDTKVAAVTIGYGDGVPRALQSGTVLLRGQKAPILGRICMDQLMVAVDGVPGVEPGDTATLIGEDGSLAITVMEVAEQSGSIPNEVLARLGGRVAGAPLQAAPVGQRVAQGAGRRENLAIQ